MSYIERDVTLNIDGKTAKFDDMVYIFKGDRDIQLNIKIIDTKMKFSRTNISGNVLTPLPKGCYARVGLVKPKGGDPVIRDRVAIEDDKVKFLIDSTVCDELDEVGIHKIQIQIYALDDDASPRWTLPSAAELEVCKPDVDFDGITPIVGIAKAGISMALSEGDTTIVDFNPDGTYNKTTWSSGDVISAEKLNKIENVLDHVVTNKVEKEDGKVLSSNDFTDDYKTKIDENSSQIKDIAKGKFKIEILEEDPTDNLYEGRIWIYKQPDLSCTSITLSASALEFTTTDTQTLTANVTPDNCEDNVVWSVDDDSIATVSNGVITPVANGECVVTATCGDYSATCTVTVSAFVTCTSITLDQTSVELTADNKTVTLVATVEPSNTTDNITWSSSATSVATVSDGLVTAKANGSAVITVSCGSQSANCSITVSGFAEVETGVFTIEQSGVTSDIEFTAYNGATYDDTNKCYTFTGGSEYLTTPFTATDAITIDIILQDNNNGNNTVILEDDSSNNITMQSDKVDSTNIVGFRYGKGNFTANNCVYGDISDGNKHHMIFIYDATTTRLTGYIDTVASKKTKTSISDVGVSDITKWILGSRSGSYGTNASIYSLKLYDRALTSDECRASLGDTSEDTGDTIDGLVLSLSGSDFSNDEQTTILPDNSGNGNNFTVSNFGYTTSSGSNGNGGIVADGSDDKLEITTLNNMNGSNGYTIVLKCAINNLSQTSRYLVEFNSDNSDNSGAIPQLAVIYGFKSKGIQFYDGKNIANINITISDTDIHTIAFTYDGTNLVGYLDDVKVDSITITNNLVMDLVRGAIFGSVGKTTECINATIYELRLYNSGLTEAQISNITTELG